MGAVYEARDVGLDRPVALKVIRPELGAGADFVARFQREARAAASVRHPGLVEVYALGEDRDLGLVYIALELVPGRELTKLIAESRGLEPERAVDLAIQV